MRNRFLPKTRGRRGVFLPNQSSSSQPAFYLPLDQADEMVAFGLATWLTNRGKSIRLVQQPGTAKLRGMSCSVGPALIFAFASGEQYALEIIAAYRGA